MNVFVQTKGGRIQAENPIDLVDLDKTDSLKDALKQKENSSCKDKNHTQGHNDLNMDQNS
jgi:hypothetical protein